MAYRRRLKGHDTFSPEQADRIRRLLKQLRGAARDKQRVLRQCLRRELRFYITDFVAPHDGLSEAGFDRLVALEPVMNLYE
ncbi:hypothetical protein [Burkholderia ubonensis]|uniref:hypothetical protein n=1 Tax=Burkholderia ubonensis TaxID=101571 RepID=UPI00075F154B|nr:hypothetical protein [Burkholderia ubonensis]KVW63733.1 hypothetical protein WK99_12865 [Burkholderia ubonensis]